MPVKIHGKEYLTVSERVSTFREDYGDELAIRTEILQIDDTRVVMVAEIVDKDGFVLSKGHAEEQWSSSQINRKSAVEVCETSAVGRALAFFHYAGDEIASADEVAHAIGAPRKKTTKAEALLHQLHSAFKSSSNEVEAIVDFFQDNGVSVTRENGNWNIRGTVSEMSDDDKDHFIDILGQKMILGDKDIPA